MRSTFSASLAVTGALVATWVLGLSPTQLSAVARTVSYRSTGGRVVDAALNEASQRPAPAVVLVGTLGHARDDWQGIAQRLADARITTLAIDLPGATLPGDPGTLLMWGEEVRSAVSFLSGRTEARPTAIGVLGAALGASLAAVAAANDPRVRSLALVSPVSDYRGLRIDNALRQFGARPVYLVASRQDSYSARSVRELSKNPPGLRQSQLAEAPASGIALLTREPDLVRLIVEWFQRTLG